MKSNIETINHFEVQANETAIFFEYSFEHRLTPEPTEEVSEEVSQRILNFIDENHEQPFFAYYAMHSGHAPFNSAERFRNQTEAGILGEVIMEADEIVGQIMDKLEKHEIADDTLVILMTDNGPTITGEQIKELFGHNQWLVDLPESANLPARTVQLQDRIDHAIQEL